MKWVKWIFSFMDWRVWTAIFLSLFNLSSAVFVYLYSDLFLQILFSCTVMPIVFLMAAMITTITDHDVKDIHKAISGYIDYVSKWWATRPGKDDE